LTKLQCTCARMGLKVRYFYSLSSQPIEALKELYQTNCIRAMIQQKSPSDRVCE